MNMEKDPETSERVNEIESVTRRSHHPRKNKHRRPVLLTMLCLFAFIFYGLLSVIFLLALFFSGWISEVRSKYLPDGTESTGVIILITSMGLLLHLVSLSGSIYMWYRRRTGYLMLSISTLILAFYQLLTDNISVFTTSVYFILIILFGIFYRRFH